MYKIVIQPSWLIRMNLVKPGLTQFYDNTDELKAKVQQLKASLGLTGVATSLHHIFPGNKIIQLLQNCRTYNPNDTSGILTSYVNDSKYKSVHSIMTRLLDVEAKDQDIHGAMDTCWSSIYWFKNNLVLGPSKRLDDPLQQIDTKILDLQKNVQDFKQLIQLNNKAILAGPKGKYFQVLRLFLTLKATNNVPWKFDAKQQKWLVSGKKGLDLPGNAGFNY